MKRKCHEVTWPFLVVLACLFVLSVTSPRAWELARRLRPGGPARDRQTAERGAAGQPVPHLASSPDPDQLSPIPSREVSEGEQPAADPPRLDADFEEVAGRVTEMLMIDPDEELISSPVEFDWSELQSQQPALPMESPEEDPGNPQLEGQDDPIPAGPDDPSSADPAAPEDAPLLDKFSLPDDVPIVESVDPEVPSEPADDAPESVWPEPEGLLARLEALSEEPETSAWAGRVRDLVQRLGPTVSEASDETLFLCDEVYALGCEANHLVTRLGDRPLASTLRRAQHALGRRLLLWRQVITAGGPFPPAAEPVEADPGRIRACLARVDAITARSTNGRTWREYLALDHLRGMIDQPAACSRHYRRLLAGAVLQRYAWPGMNAAQRQLLDSRPMADLESALRDWAAEPVDLGGLLRNLERYEEQGLPSDAHLVAEDYQRLKVSPLTDHQALSRLLEIHYRNANFRLAVTEQLLNRLMPDREPKQECVRDRVLGKPVWGRSLTSTNVAVQLIPDRHRLRLALKIDGLVSALTSSTAGPATFYSDSRSSYTALKPIEITTRGLRLSPVRIDVNNDTRLRALETSLDPIPLVGSLVKEVARSRHEQSRYEVRREVEWKVASRAKREIDEEADAGLRQLDERLKQRALQPFAAMWLGPTMISSQTTGERLTMRLRLASPGQLGSHTPRPQAPADSLMSCQVHESALNNVLQQMNLRGGTFTPAELRRRIADSFNAPELLQAELDRDDLSITFAQRDAVQVRCREGRITVSLSIAELRKAPRQWNDFRVSAVYRPETGGLSARLVRDGVVELETGDLSTRSQIALRGIFSKTFSKQRPWNLTPEDLAGDSRMAGLAVTQFVVQDGWIGLALGPDRNGPPPIIARRNADDAD